jgi:nucleoside-diphosphate-sugar epimerase
MILLTGGGAFYQAFRQIQECGKISLRHIEDATPDIKKSRVIIHNAASINCRTVLDAIADNFLPTVRLVNLCEKVNPGVRLIYLSSMSMLASENEYMDVEKMTPYSYSKYLSETFIVKSQLANACSVRFSTLFYENPERDGLSKLISDAVNNNEITIYNGGEARRDFIPLDLAVQYVAKLCRYQPKRKILNIASAQEISFGKVADILQEKIPNLKVNDLPLATNRPQVLSSFSKEHVSELGELEFSVEHEIEDYIKNLRKELLA